MTDPFPRFENSDNGGLRLVIAVGSDTFVCLLVLGCCFLELDCVDLDTVLGVRERGVESEGVCLVDLSAFGMLGQWPDFCAGEGL